MKENYVPSLRCVLKSEGLWSDNPKDLGGATMKGITLDTYRRWKRNPYITKEQLKAISDSEVYDLYKQLYWNKVLGDDLPLGIDYAVFDASVNLGVGRASKLIQEAVGVVADGVLGQKSLYAIQTANPKELIEKFSNAKKVYYESRPKEQFEEFGKGWLNRVAEVKMNVQNMVV